jgi:Uma2 family endonuclease
MTGALLHRFTREDYHRMGESGSLAPDARVELLDGHIIDMLPIGPFHGSLVSRLTRKLNTLGQDRWLTFPQCSLDLGKYYEPVPDLMLLRPSADEYEDKLPLPADVFVLIEVSDSTLLLDRTEKLPAYATAGVAEVWIMNVPQRVVEIYRNPVEGEYREQFKVRTNGQIAPQAFPEATLPVAEIFRAP